MMNCPKCNSDRVTFIKLVRRGTANIFMYVCRDCEKKYMVKSTIRGGKIVKEYYNE